MRKIVTTKFSEPAIDEIPSSIVTEHPEVFVHARCALEAVSTAHGCFVQWSIVEPAAVRGRAKYEARFKKRPPNSTTQ